MTHRVKLIIHLKINLIHFLKVVKSEYKLVASAISALSNCMLL